MFIIKHKYILRAKTKEKLEQRKLLPNFCIFLEKDTGSLPLNEKEDCPIFILSDKELNYSSVFALTPKAFCEFIFVAE